MTTLDLCWNLLSTIGNIPNELIFKIMYEFEGVKHPIVIMLLDETRQDKYMKLYRTPFSKKLRTHYYKHGVNDTLLKIINEQDDIDIWHNRCGDDYIELSDPGSFIPRQFGRLYYHILNDNLKVDNYSYKYLFNTYNKERTFFRRRGLYLPIITNEPINGREKWEEIRKNIICLCIIRGRKLMSENRQVCKYCYS